jgi:glycerophosphoryl diester phosphodiesterase
MPPPNPLLDLTRRLVIGHRGAAARAPENTLPSFQLALDQGADAFELDVHASSDGIPVVFHDATLERTTNLSGPIAARSAAELRAADAGFQFTSDGGASYPWRGKGVGVSPLAEVLEAFPETPIIIEIKDARTQHAVARVLDSHGATERCVVAADDPACVTAFEEPPFLRGSSRPEITRLFLGSLIGFPPRRVNYRLLAVPDRHHHLSVATRRFFAAARRLHAPVHVWTVNDPARAAQLWRDGACGIISDDPGAMRKADG